MVLNTPLSIQSQNDSIFWWANSNGEYSVRSGYWLGRLGAINKWATGTSVEEKKCWQIVWNLHGPPKLKHFLWRACHGILAVMERLFYRHCTSSSLCTICQQQPEKVTHALFSCKYAKEIW